MSIQIRSQGKYLPELESALKALGYTSAYAYHLKSVDIINVLSIYPETMKFTYLSAHCNYIPLEDAHTAILLIGTMSDREIMDLLQQRYTNTGEIV